MIAGVGRVAAGAGIIIISVPPYTYAVLALGWLLWFAPFPLSGWNFQSAEKTDRRARWGILLELIGYSALWQTAFWARSPGMVRVVLSIGFLALAALLSWTGTRALGRHLRLDAALSSNHELVRSGPYRFLRHPIYTSMFCILLGTGFLITPLPLLLLGVFVFIAGTEIRVRIEDQLLLARFGEQFRDYQRSVSAYIPLLR